MDTIGESTGIEQLSEFLATFFEKATSSIEKLLSSDTVQDIVTATEDIGEALDGTINAYKLFKSVASIPTKIYLHKFERFCRELCNIPLEKRRLFMNKLGRKRFDQESFFILNVINRIEEENKIPFLIKILEAYMDNIINNEEYYRLTILVDRTLACDLVYLKDNITTGPVALCSDSDFGLAASGLLVAVGNEWIGDLSEECLTDTGFRFMYTETAKKLAEILFAS